MTRSHTFKVLHNLVTDAIIRMDLLSSGIIDGPARQVILGENIYNLKQHFNNSTIISPNKVKIEPNEEFEIKDIINKRITQNRTEYLVKWKGYT